MNASFQSFQVNAHIKVTSVLYVLIPHEGNNFRQSYLKYWYVHASYLHRRLTLILVYNVTCLQHKLATIDIAYVPMYTPRTLFNPSIYPSVNVPTFGLGVVGHRQIDDTVHVLHEGYFHQNHGACGQSHLQHRWVPFMYCS